MRTLIAAAVLALAGPAFGDTTLNADKFTVTVNDFADASLVGGAVQLQWLPSFLSFSSPAGNSSASTFIFDFAFMPKPGYALHGELVSFSMNLNVAEVDEPSILWTRAFANFSVDVDGQHSLSKESEGGFTQYSATWLIADPHFVVRTSGDSQEGLACAVVDSTNDCNFGTSWVDLDAYTQLTSLSVTPLLSAVPEPGMAVSWTAALGTFALAGLLTRRSVRRVHRR